MRGVKTRLLGIASAYCGVLVAATAIGGFDAKPQNNVDPTWIFQAVVWPFLAVIIAASAAAVVGGLWALAVGRAPWPWNGRRG